jgi:murein DD-endopeptidase MepM/ murein hydrolase activator NlpD
MLRPLHPTSFAGIVYSSWVPFSDRSDALPLTHLSLTQQLRVSVMNRRNLSHHVLRFQVPRFHRSRLLLISGIVSGMASATGLLGAAPLGAQPIDNLGGDAPAAVDSGAGAIAPAPLPEPAIAPPPVYNPAPAIPEPTSSPAAAAAPSNEAFIDPAGYSVGATYRTRDLALPANALEGRGSGLPSLANTVQVGPVSINSTGFGVGTTPSLKDFYQRTLRPPGRLGNGNIQLIFPLSIPAPITSLFGWRVHPLSGDARFHSGTDLGAPLGTPVLAAYAGQVALADFLGGYGLAVALNHNKGSQQTLYGHLSEIFVKPGEWVKQGSVIGRVGSTGNSTGPHLHFEFRELTPEGWVALDSGAQLEYSLAQLMKLIDVSEKGIASAPGVLVSQQSIAGVSGKIAWQPQAIAPKPDLKLSQKLDQPKLNPKSDAINPQLEGQRKPDPQE